MLPSVAATAAPKSDDGTSREVGTRRVLVHVFACESYFCVDSNPAFVVET
jgi:hypothetical protein